MSSLLTMPVVFAEAEDRSGAETGLAAVADSEEGLTVSGDTMTILEDMPFIAMAYIGTEDKTYDLQHVRLIGKNIGGAGIDTWYLERSAVLGEAVEGAALVPENIYDYRKFPYPVGVAGGLSNEVITAYSLEDDEAGQAHDNFCVLVLTNGQLPVVKKEDVKIDYEVTCTLAATGAALTWKSDAPAFDVNIPSGNYRIVGADMISATAIAARIEVTGQTGGRPPAFIPRRGEKDPIPDHNYMIYPRGIPWKYGGNQINNLRFEYICEANETPGYAKLFLQKA